MSSVRRWSVAQASLALLALLMVGSVLLLGLLSWGIMTGSILATVMAGAGFAAIIVLAGAAFLAPEDLRSQSAERTLGVASATLRHMSGGLTKENAAAVCQLLLSETNAAAIALTDTEQTLAYVGDGVLGYQSDTPNSAATREVLVSKRVQTFSDLGQSEWVGVAPDESGRGLPAGIFAPLTVADRSVGTLKLFYRRGGEVDRTQLAIVRGLAELLSTQLSTHELEVQAELTARAEVKALQAQINPHFLFNALNTMAALTRTDPVRARDLLREFSVYYRRTLESSEAPFSLREELAQTRRYLKIERARFGEERIVEAEVVEPGLERVLVPGFIVQPLVENAVRHGLRDEGTLHIDVQATTDGDDVLIAVADDGVGMSEESARRLLSDAPQDRGARGRGRGAGIAIRNVAERIERRYGTGSGVEVMSKVGTGTVVTLRLVGAVPDVTEVKE
ncbi:histidine kinase [Olsenella sp. HMSC062G07]|uniref:GAF domain-containing sensor histidine kinase n=1 Tax=Olsenella sp. HMSC062G07 TaxID=1739330 RepID=UPI000B2C50B1|nr:histidine kinase [Olsenella sp. HMSC062G07]